MDKWASPVGGISLQSSEISVGGLKIFPCKRSLAGLAGMKIGEMRVRRRNYVISFSNFQVNISINIKFHPGRRDENYQINARDNSSRQPSYLAHRAGSFPYKQSLYKAKKRTFS